MAGVHAVNNQAHPHFQYATIEHRLVTPWIHERALGRVDETGAPLTMGMVFKSDKGEEPVRRSRSLVLGATGGFRESAEGIGSFGCGGRI
jgi:hypothetical protein